MGIRIIENTKCTYLKTEDSLTFMLDKNTLLWASLFGVKWVQVLWVVAPI